MNRIRTTQSTIVLAVGALVFTVVLGAVVAWAVSPHFIRASATVNNDGSLTVDFKEAGLGTSQNIDYLLSADALATYACVTFPFGPNSSATKKFNLSGPVMATGTSNSDKNGQVMASLTVEPLGSGDLACPGIQEVFLVSTSYTNIVLTDTTNDDSISLEGPFSSGCLLPHVRNACD